MKGLPEAAVLASAPSSGCRLAVATCAEQLTRLGALVAPALDPVVEWSIPWRADGDNDELPGAEAIVQAECGLMHVHGLRWGRPRRLGLNVASVAAGLLAAQGVIAAMIARRRGLDIRTVRVPALAGGLVFLRHHLAIATCSDRWRPVLDPEGTGTPLRCADGIWVEVEALTFDSWARFLRLVGVESGLEESWSGLVFRFLTGRCSVPAELHRAVAQRASRDVRMAAAQAGIAACEVRGYEQLLADGTVAEPWTISRASRADGAGAGGRGANTDPPAAPLGGLRVVEITTRLQGPLAGLLLGLLGAEVVKIEPPGGDFGKLNPPHAGSVGAAYLAYNQGKSTVELDYKDEEGRRQLLDHLRHADVFLHNWPPGRAERLGLDQEGIRSVNPGLVCTEAGAWGSTPGAPAPFATDCLVQAHAGCAEGLNPIGQPPLPSLVPLADVTGALLACVATLAGLLLRECEGIACQARTSLMAAATALQADVLRDMSTGLETERRRGRLPPQGLHEPVQTADGFVAVAMKPGHRIDAPPLDWRRRTSADLVSALLGAGVAAAVVEEDLGRLPARLPRLIQNVSGACHLPAAPWSFG